MRSHTFQITTAAMLALALAPNPAAAAAPDAVPNRILVGYERGVDAGEARAVRSRFGLDRVRALQIGPRADVVAVAESEPGELEVKAREIAARPGVAWAQPDYLVELHKLPRDGFFARSQWGLRNLGSWTDTGGTQQSSTPGADIDAPLAWDVTTGNPGVIVGVVDSGIYAAHREFQGRVLPGRDFIAADDNPDDQEPNGHGSHVAGIIGARADGLGTVGVSWDLRLLPVRAVSAVDAEPPGSTAEALAFAADRGASVVNMSFGSAADSQPAYDAVFGSHPGTLFVASAGNGGGDQVGDDNDADPKTPCASPAANVVCVASTTDDDLRSGFSNFGRNTVDLAAPGSSILSVNGAPATRTPSSYRQSSGTSMAAPHVSGIAALLRAGTPWRSTLQIKSCILGGADPIPALTGITVTGGRANARRALDACADRTPPERAAALASPAPGARLRSRNARFSFAPGADSESGLARNELLIDGQPFPAGAQGPSAFAPAQAIAHGPHMWTIRTIDRSGNARDADTRAIGIDNRGPKARVKVLSASAKRGVLLRVKLDERATRLSAATVLSRKVRKRIGSKRRTLAGKVRRSLKAGTRKVRVKLPARLRKRGRGQRVKLTDDLGNTARKTIAIRLRR